MRKACISRSRSRRSESRLNSASGSSRQSREVSLTCAALRARVVDGDQERGDALADRVPGRLGDGDDEHVALVHAGQLGGVAQADVDVAARELVDARVRLDIGRDRDRGVVHQALADTGERVSAPRFPAPSDARPARCRRAADGPASGWRRSDRITSRARNSARCALDCATTPTQRLPSNSSSRHLRRRSRSSGCCVGAWQDRDSRWLPKRAAHRHWRS